MADVEITAGSTSTVDIAGLDDIKADLKLELPQPLQTESSASLALEPVKADVGTDSHLRVDPLKADLGTTSNVHLDPLQTDSNLSVDLKPAVVDLCLTLNVGKVPSVCVSQPYHHHVGFTLFGLEVWGYTFSGEQETIVREYRPEPKVALGETWSPPPRPRPAPPIREAGGLRIKLGS